MILGENNYFETYKKRIQRQKEADEQRIIEQAELIGKAEQAKLKGQKDMLLKQIQHIVQVEKDINFISQLNKILNSN